MHKKLLSRDNTDLNEFKNVLEMEMYISILLFELSQLKSLEHGINY